jgi:hypothetical protein
LAAGILLAAGSAGAATPAQQAGASNAILLQGFHWNSAGYAGPDWYNTLMANVGDLSTMGFTHVWFPPPSDSAAREGYLPRQLNKLDSSYGSSAELTNVISAFKSRGVKAIADVVVNHRVGTTGWSDFTNPNWTTYAIVNSDECNCGLGAADTGDGFSGGRDLAHTNVGEVQNGIVNWLNFTLKPVGFSGLRFDYVKGFGANYVAQYANAFGAEFCVGELWPNFDINNIDANRQAIMNWINGDVGDLRRQPRHRPGRKLRQRPEPVAGAVRQGDRRLCLHPQPPGHPDRVLPAHLQLEPEDPDCGADEREEERRRELDLGGGHPAGDPGPVCGHRHRHGAPAGHEDRSEQLEPGRRLDPADFGHQLRGLDEVSPR